MRSRRRNAPSVPASLQRSASASNRRFSLPENWRRLAIATTSGSRRALRARPSLQRPYRLLPRRPRRRNPTIHSEKTSAMRSCACPTCTLNCPRQVSHLTLARGGDDREDVLSVAREAKIASIASRWLTRPDMPWLALPQVRNSPCRPLLRHGQARRQPPRVLRYNRSARPDAAAGRALPVCRTASCSRGAGLGNLGSKHHGAAAKKPRRCPPAHLGLPNSPGTFLELILWRGGTCRMQ